MPRTLGAWARGWGGFHIREGVSERGVGVKNRSFVRLCGRDSQLNPICRSGFPACCLGRSPLRHEGGRGVHFFLVKGEPASASERRWWGSTPLCARADQNQQEVFKWPHDSLLRGSLERRNTCSDDTIPSPRPRKCSTPGRASKTLPFGVLIHLWPLFVPGRLRFGVEGGVGETGFLLAFLACGRGRLFFRGSFTGSAGGGAFSLMGWGGLGGLTPSACLPLLEGGPNTHDCRACGAKMWCLLAFTRGSLPSWSGGPQGGGHLRSRSPLDESQEKPRRG
jgi:hypothetical protein